MLKKNPAATLARAAIPASVYLIMSGMIFALFSRSIISL